MCEREEGWRLLRAGKFDNFEGTFLSAGQSFYGYSFKLEMRQAYAVSALGS